MIKSVAAAPVGWSLRPATDEDAQWLADLKAVTMRADLERLGFWDRDWARQRFLQAFVPANTHVVIAGDVAVGSIAVRPEEDAQWVEHFYLDPSVQGRGLGRAVLTHVMARHGDHRPFQLAIDRGSRVRRLYESVGFVHHHDADNGVDQIFRATASTSSDQGKSHG